MACVSFISPSLNESIIFLLSIRSNPSTGHFCTPLRSDRLDNLGSSASLNYRKSANYDLSKETPIRAFSSPSGK